VALLIGGKKLKSPKGWEKIEDEVPRVLNILA
jgi:hypothetical protein